MAMDHHDKRGPHDPYEDPDRIMRVEHDDEPPEDNRRWYFVAAAGVLAGALVVGGVYVLSQPPQTEVNHTTQRVALSSDGLPAQASEVLVGELTPMASQALQGRLAAPLGVTAAAPDTVPDRVLTAYRRAESSMAVDHASCKLPWWLVAAVGKVESDHANKGTVDAAGNVLPPLRGPRLDGSTTDTRAVQDTDGGRIDGDAVYDRAMGPMQVVPSTWQLMARDGNGDGVADPDNIDDAALTAASFLCSSGQDFSTAQGLASGVLYTNDQSTYARNVLSWASYYRGATTVPTVAPAPKPTQAPTVRSATSGRPPISTRGFSAVGSWYDDFDQVSDAEVTAALSPFRR